MNLSKLPVASAINAEHEACIRSGKAFIEHAMNAGKLLIEQKARVAHGEWGDWLAANIAFSESVAQRYMRLARHPEIVEQAKASRATDLSVRAALQAMASPEKQTGASTDASDRLDELETKIDAALWKVSQVGRAFAKIRDGELWRQSDKSSFEEYCKANHHSVKLSEDENERWIVGLMELADTGELPIDLFEIAEKLSA
ncbi:MAG TPA: DUF3102 domain-containing protein [Tepidisphaeraceae bacterium]|nr:DUF3102 domain-containing protein [Tepidisphaeraceae bacterium]